LGIAQWTIRVSRANIPTSRKPRKSLPTSIQTLGDFIQVKRYEKKLTLGQLAQKMGIATATVRDWEEGVNQPDSKQMALLTKYLGFELANIPIHPGISGTYLASANSYSKSK